MRKLLTIKFIGTNYHGWQVQKNALTVQEVLQNAMEQLFGTRPDVCGCSRTDSGVHAKMFCCHFDSPINIGNKGIILGLNRYLPNDISVADCVDVADDFHARYSVKCKTYEYKIDTSDIRCAFSSPFVYQYGREVDLNLAASFCEKIVGKHDFAAFCAAGSSVTDTVRTVFDAHIEVNGSIVTFVVSADGFLYNMVRILVGTMLSVCEGKISVEQIQNIITSKDRSLAGPTAMASGLALREVNYDI